MIEGQLIRKVFYESYTEGNETDHPIRILGEEYLKEQEKEVPELSHIRYAQGEIYFHNKDFEAAIFKWENIVNELEPWAKKNTADAYFELDLLPTAEEIYKSIKTENIVLNTEISLQLLSLYMVREKHEQADRVVKKVVALNPDYPNVTKIARSFYERQQDWESAVELAVNEAVRTRSLQWFEVLNDYIDRGATLSFQPDYFKEALHALYGMDKAAFERLAASLWRSYDKQPSYIAWLYSINGLLRELDINREYPWHELSRLHRDTYMDLVSGQYYMKELSHVLPQLIMNWTKLSDAEQSLFAGSAAMAWEEMFPGSIEYAALEEADRLIKHLRGEFDGLKKGLLLFETICLWAEEKELTVAQRYRWMIKELLDFNVNHVLMAGMNGNGKSAFINSIVGENLLGSPTPSVMLIKNGDEVELNELTENEVYSISSLEEFYDRTNGTLPKMAGETFYEINVPSPFLAQNKLAFIDTPGAGSVERNEIAKFLPMADILLFVTNINTPLTSGEWEFLRKLKKKAPKLQVHFLLNKVDTIYNDQEAQRILMETSDRIHTEFPHSQVFLYSSLYSNTGQKQEWTQFISSAFSYRDIEEERTERLLNLVKDFIQYLLTKRVEMERGYVHSIMWDEEMTKKLNGAIHQTEDLESEKAAVIANRYHQIKEDVRVELAERIPRIFKECADSIHEDSDFRDLHIRLNDEMNEKVHQDIENRILPKLYDSLQEWITFAKAEFEDSQMQLSEMSDGFNTLYEEERIILEGDFRVLEDWRRDAERMTTSVQVEKVNILLKNNPSQLLLKGAGKLFGALPQNKNMLYNSYRRLLENEDYQESADSIISNFMLQFDLFEKSLKRDVSFFFREPIAVLKQNVEETLAVIETNKQLLENMKTNPEIYEDALTFYELKTRQYERMI
ncbi:dynamin family protein [Falsibacillus pallidus]|nr:dynamin family protein [Falsibacillus pallidus]